VYVQDCDVQPVQDTAYTRISHSGCCKTLILGIVIRHLDNSDGLFYKIPDTDANKLQRVQNVEGKLVLQKGKDDNATSNLKDLHWLPVKLRVQFKIIVTVMTTMMMIMIDVLRPLLCTR